MGRCFGVERGSTCPPVGVSELVLGKKLVTPYILRIAKTKGSLPKQVHFVCKKRCQTERIIRGSRVQIFDIIEVLILAVINSALMAYFAALRCRQSGLKLLIFNKNLYA